MTAQDIADCFRLFLEESIISLLLSGASFTLYYVSSKVLQSCQDNLNHFQFAPLIRDFSQIRKEKSEFPYAVVEGQVFPNSEAISSHYDDRARGVVKDLKVWQLKKVWSAVLQTWEMSKNLFSSYERHVPMHLADRKNTKMFVDNFSECSQHKLLEEVSTDSKPNNDDVFKQILDNILQREVIVGYRRVEKMLHIGQTVIFCGKVSEVFEGGKFTLRLSKPDSPLSFECTSLSYESFLNVKRFNVSVMKIITFTLGVGVGLMVIYCAFKFRNILLYRLDEQRELREPRERINEFVLEVNDLEITEPTVGSTAVVPPNIPGRSNCSICYERPVCLLVKNCNHACLCIRCAPKVGRRCPICRAEIQKFEKIYLP